MVSWDNRLKAAEVKVVPSVGIRQEYNDNIFFTPSEEVHDAITTISPGLEMASRTERLDAYLGGQLKKRIYRDNDDLDETDYDGYGRVRYQLAPRLSAAGDVGYLKDSRPDRDIETTGILLGIEKRKRYSFSGSAEYEVSELARTTFSYSFYDEDWENPELNDTVTHSVNWGLIRTLEAVFPNAWGRLNAGYSHYDYTSEQSFSGMVLVPFPPFPPIPATQNSSISQNTQLDYYSMTVGVRHQLSEKYSFLVDLGTAYVSTEETTVRSDSLPLFPLLDQTRSEVRTTSGWGGIGAVELDYRGEATDCSLRLRHDIGAPSGSVGATTRTSLAADIRHRFTYELRGGFSASYFINKADRTGLLAADTDEQTLNLAPRLRYDINPDVFLEALYRYSWRDNRVSGTQSTRSLVYGGIQAQWDLLE